MTKRTNNHRLRSVSTVVWISSGCPSPSASLSTWASQGGNSGPFPPRVQILLFSYYFFIEKCFSVTIELEKWNFTMVSPLETWFWSSLEKIPCCLPCKKSSDSHGSVATALQKSTYREQGRNEGGKGGTPGAVSLRGTKNPNNVANTLFNAVNLPPTDLRLNRGAPNLFHAPAAI